MRRSFWEKVEEAKTEGITTEEFERIENLESAIAHYEDMIDEHKKQIECIKNMANCRLEKFEV